MVLRLVLTVAAAGKPPSLDALFPSGPPPFRTVGATAVASALFVRHSKVITSVLPPAKLKPKESWIKYSEFDSIILCH